MAHVDPVRHTQRVIAFAIRPEDAGIHIVQARAKMVVQIAIEMVVPLDCARIENREIESFLAVFQAAHQRAVFLLFAQPDGREMHPVIGHILESRRVQRALHGVVLLPGPFAGRTFHGAPGDVILVRHQSEVFEPPLRLDRGRRFKKIRFGKRPNRRCLDEANRQIAGRNVPRVTVEVGVRRPGAATTANEQQNRQPTLQSVTNLSRSKTRFLSPNTYLPKRLRARSAVSNHNLPQVTVSNRNKNNLAVGPCVARDALPTPIAPNLVAAEITRRVSAKNARTVRLVPRRLQFKNRFLVTIVKAICGRVAVVPGQTGSGDGVDNGMVGPSRGIVELEGNPTIGPGTCSAAANG